MLPTFKAVNGIVYPIFLSPKPCAFSGFKNFTLTSWIGIRRVHYGKEKSILKFRIRLRSGHG